MFFSYIDDDAGLSITVMMSKSDENDSLKAFIQTKTEETIRKYLVMFHRDEFIHNPLGCIRVNQTIIDKFHKQNNKTYDIYVKLKSQLPDDTFNGLF